jgi:ethanolamine utilization microcompartment shell protein EutS
MGCWDGGHVFLILNHCNTKLISSGHENCYISASIKAGFISSFGGTLIIPALMGQLEEEGRGHQIAI